MCSDINNVCLSVVTLGYRQGAVMLYLPLKLTALQFAFNFSAEICICFVFILFHELMIKPLTSSIYYKITLFH